jgi:hypothetical protein
MTSIYDVTVVCESCGDAVSLTPPQNKLKYIGIAAVIFGVLGVAAGTTIGIATAGFGIVATPFTTAIGAYTGYRSGGWVAEKRDGGTCPECGYNH